MLLPVLVELGTVIKAAEQHHTRAFHEGPSPYVNDTDPESGDGRFGKIPPSLVVTLGTLPYPRLRSLLEHNSPFPQRLSPHGGTHAAAANPFPPWPLIQSWGY